MASLQLLPNEVLLEVFLNIDSARDVLALALQCRRFHDLCDLKTRRKYRRIEIGPHYKGHDLDILLSILRKPYRGLYVRHLTFVVNLRYIGGSSRWMKCKPEKSLPPQILDKLKKAIKEAGFGRRKKMVLNMILEAEKANFGRLDNKQFFYRQAVAALIISLSPRLESMDLGYTGYSETFASFGPAKLREMLAQERGERPWPEDYLLHRLLSKTNAQGKEASFLRNLRSVRFLNSSGEPREYEQTNVYGFLNLVRRLPSLEAVRFDTIENPQEEETMPCPPRVANYKKIEILRSVVDSRTLCAVIESARELRHFAFQVGGRAFLEEYVREIDPDRVYKSLLLHRDTLEHLQLDFEDHIDRCEMFDAECRERKKQERRDMEEEGMEYYTEDEVRIIGEDGRETWTYWDEELEEERQNLDQRRGKAVASSSGPSLLKGFARLKYLAIGARLLFYYTRILEQDSTDDEAFSMADHLPPNLESLLIYDYERGLNSEPNIDERNDRYSRLGKFSLANGRINLDRHISKLLEEKKDKLPLLRSVKGVEEVIQGGKTREEYDGDYEDEDDDEDERVSSPLSPFSHYSLSDNEGLSEHSKSDGDGEEAISSGGDGEAKDE